MPSERARTSRYFLVLIIGGSGVLHFLVPRFYQRIVPRALGHQEEIVAISGAAEIGCAALMVLPRTRRLGGWLTAALLLAVWPANFQQALDGKPYSRTGVLSSPALLWWRLPLQLPLIRMALRVARDGQVGDSKAAAAGPG
ncbi:MAG TPA: hypothetical protein VNV65_00450 [Candidatus Solibacter sp.]|jgi:uncharacterized membrane protein|nr:hypothetical protein [Candidatus Solibacter sp.]